LVDSGADGSVFPEEFAETLGVDLEKCEQAKVHTGNGLAIHYCHAEPVKALIAGRKVDLRGTFGPIGVPVLGREDFFSQFYVEVDERNRVVIITPHDDEA
jgi:hypothetical protein